MNLSIQKAAEELAAAAGGREVLVRLLEVIEQRDVSAAEGLCLEMLAAHSLGVRPLDSMEDRDLRRELHEALDCCLRTLLFAQEGRGEFWRKVLLPTQIGVLAHGNLICNGMWLRRTGSTVPDENDEVLEPAVLAALDLEGQARMLGRFMVANDGAANVQYAEVTQVLDPMLVPAWTEWTVSCHGQSPDALAPTGIRLNQERVLQEVLELWKNQPLDLPASPVALATHYERPYRTAGSTLPVGEKVVGEWLSKLYWSMGPAETKGLANYPEFEALRGAEFLVFCPNWREQHVIHRCLSPLIEPLRERDSSRVLMLHEQGSAKLGRCAEGWKARCLEVEMRQQGHFLFNIGVAAEELKTCDVDLMFFPELCPGDASAWMAMQRVARVQVTGYGLPNSSGSREMDYFLGGEDVERDGSDYCEQLVVIPGWGQGFVEPPEPKRPRQRPQVEERIQMVAIATHQKLNTELLQAWNEIMRDEEHVSLEIFPSLRDLNTQLLAPRMMPHFDSGSVELNGWTVRDELLETLVESDFYLNTFPYGGYNCLIEALSCGLPIVTIEGNHARNRSAAALLRRLEMPEFLIARDLTGYIAAAKRLIRDGGLRAELRARLADRRHVLDVLHDPEGPANYTAALDWMREQGPREGRRPGPPVLIRAGEQPQLLR